MFQNNTIIALIDFDNFYPQITQYQDLGGLIHEFNRIVGEALEINPTTEHIIIRLYGGWMENGLLTRLATLIHQEIVQAGFFPMRHPKTSGLLRGDIILATSLLSLPLLIWQNTLKQRNGLPRLRLDKRLISTTCETDKERCPIQILEKFSKKRGKICPVNGCTQTNSNAFKVIGQKMVDIMLACDILFLADLPHVSSIMIMSDDFDIHPAIAFASIKTQKDIILIHNNPRQSPIISQSLAGLTVRIKDWRV